VNWLQVIRVILWAEPWVMENAYLVINSHTNRWKRPQEHVFISRLAPCSTSVSAVYWIVTITEPNCNVYNSRILPLANQHRNKLSRAVLQYKQRSNAINPSLALLYCNQDSFSSVHKLPNMHKQPTLFKSALNHNICWTSKI